MYHFVKFNKTWYLMPETLQDVIDHFIKICGREFKQGFDDFKDNVRIRKSCIDGKPYLDSMNHSSSVWRNAVELCEMKLKGLNWVEGACGLEKQTYEDRINRFLAGKPMFFTDGLPYYPPKEWPSESEYEDEVWKDELIYPFEYNYDEVRFIQWPDGKHWYAKIGKIDICDQWGNYKWSDKYYAMEIAKKWCRCGGDWKAFENQTEDMSVLHKQKN